MTDTDVAPKRLTEYSHGAGCACKLPPGLLGDVVAKLAPVTDERLLVGSATGDDAAVWRLDDDRALVLTTDFFTPIVDDARTWGKIAAVNAVSDVYAMGGRPLIALNLVAWNVDELSMDLLGEVLAGAQEAAAEAGFAIVGGHSVDDPEPKYGLAVVGEAHPDRLLTNAGLLPGQVLVLTKALGTGIVSTAVKRGVAPPDVATAAVASMLRLNADASRAALAAGATGATDVTGFSLLGHLGRMAIESGVDVIVDVASVPVLDGVRDLAAAGVVPGGSGRNRAFVADRLDVGDGVDDLDVTVLADAQTSGGLVVGVDPDRVDELVADLAGSGHPVAVIGEAVAASPTGPGRLALR
ncbi:MAG: selenide, water dikinase SelD [Acidimicrobiales bacterium]|jgi:selenide,water dikinase|nr:selenide, water dikinase SelD [Acidimicrobiales bacterium]